MATSSTSLRRRALEKLSLLSAQSAPAAFEKSDLNRLCKACPTHSQSNGDSRGASRHASFASQIPMNIREFEVLLALCKAAPSLKSPQDAEKLAQQLGPYMLEAHTQAFVPSPFFRQIDPSPNESLSYNLTVALLSLGINHEALKTVILEKLWSFLDRCAYVTGSMTPSYPVGAEINGDDFDTAEDALKAATITTSILGFLDAASSHANFWTVTERLNLIKKVKSILSTDFMNSVETAFSALRNSTYSERDIRDWKRCVRHYAAIGRPLGATLLQRSFMWFLLASSSLLVARFEDLKGSDVLELLMNGRGLSSHVIPTNSEAVETIADCVTEEMAQLESGADFLQRLGSAWQQRLAFAVKAAALTSYLNCALLNEDAADPIVLMAWLEDTLADRIQMADETLASAVLRCMALLSKMSPKFAPEVSKLLPRFIVQGGPRRTTVAVAAACLAYVLKLLSSDAMITTLWTLGNVLSPGSDSESRGMSLSLLANGGSSQLNGIHTNGHRDVTGSSISLELAGEEDKATVHGNIVQAICGVACNCGNDEIIALAQSMLLQKIHIFTQSDGSDARIMAETASLALRGGPLEFRSLLKLYAKLSHDAVVDNNTSLADSVRSARNHLAKNMKRNSPLFDEYLETLLESIISKGDVHQGKNSRAADFELATKEIAELLQPLGLLMSTNNVAKDESIGDDILSLVRDAWYNIVIHGFSTDTPDGKRHLSDLRLIASHSRPLVGAQRGDQVESDIELNPVLRRGANSDHESVQKKRLSALLPAKVHSDIRGLSYRKVIFLQAAYLVETLRAEAGDCSKALTYFLEPHTKRDDLGNPMQAIAEVVIDKFIRKTITGPKSTFAAPLIAEQLAQIFSGCCHRIDRVQQASSLCAWKVVRAVPSALCEKSSLFALLELLTIMWSSCLEAETNEYDWRPTFTSTRGKVTVRLSDNYEFRRKTLTEFYQNAKSWMIFVINVAPLDVKGLLQTYLSEYHDDGAYGHISLGRSFAMEMGSMIPQTDQRLGAIERQSEFNLNTSSDFIAQYTSRQEYRYAEVLSDHKPEWVNFMQIGDRQESESSSARKDSQDVADAILILEHLNRRILEKKFVSIGELRDVLRRAAALLCRSGEKDQCAIVHYLVGIPFQIFNKQSINLGISLWLGVINENPRMEPRILMEVAQCWEVTAQRRLGIFHGSLLHPDPFYIKEEFAPSDKEALHKRQQFAHNLLAPHSRLLQFLASHFNATHLGSPHTQRIFYRLLRVTLEGVMHSTGHPLARDIRYQIVLFGLKVLRHGLLSLVSQWRLKDRILSAALSWFSFAPRWTFGGNRLQVKAEVKILRDVKQALMEVSFIGATATGNMKSLQSREELLQILLESEQSRLLVWLFPVNEPAGTLAADSSSRGVNESTLLGLVPTAWSESPSLAVQLVSRFQFPKLLQEVRSLLLKFPEKAIHEPEALPIILNGSLPSDVNSQLKYLLYWAPVNPVTAVTYFLPAYRNHPFIVQYAMRALESHSVDVTFFYVPQIVQTLRYDALGYVERYIVETAQFSQLFAHQIIWNMKANAYKDDESLIPDPVKPTLDKVMNRMIESFSGVDRAFYEKEFTFFDEVTSISGKLKPYIKRPKPEKKQKIEEELRKIKVEVGVYLPSNPDGVVIGIDRKSGKPLQSHAKAPYMATFRIQKSKGDMEETDGMLEVANKEKSVPVENTIEIWQSAIFKVGDDCRQDVLALQMIAAFRGIFNHVGLDVYVFPYRVTATAPGCGVIDVLPNSISRDMLGREAVNGLYEYFISKYGNEDSLRFQEARTNFVKSMAAYSIISFLLQFKDRHNGNIMIDDAGHILHIDFGFCFDIAPGGVKFERSPFKLTTEMVSVMGGSTEHQAYKWFEELCVKAFLASRQYVDKLSQMVQLMMDSGLPCFKPESVKHFRERFVLELSERDAANFMRGLVKKSHSSYSTGVYDQFQLMTNGIPY